MKRFISSDSRRDFYILYTLVFGIISFFIYWQFEGNGKSLVWSHDGIPQHLNSLAYYGRYLREALYTIFVKHKLSLPMWDMNIGYGSDILTTLHYYVIGDPLTLLSVFVPANKTEVLYEVLIFLRIYLAGISFSIFCFYHKNPKQATFMGTLIYIFAGWTIYAAMKHPYFSNPMIYLPLILVGIDKIYKREKPWLFIWATAVSAMSNFYFFYMICIFMFIYAAFRYFGIFSRRRRSVKDVLVWLVKFIGYYAVALMIAAVIFLPVIMTLFGTDRFQAENYVPLLYDRIYYEKYLGDLIGENMIQWGVAGYSAVAMAGVFVLFSKKRKYLDLKWGFALLNLFLLVPFAGHVLNGFSYVSNRWIWAYGMLIAYIFVKAYPEFFTLKVQEKKKIFMMSVVYCVLALLAKAARTQRNMAGVLVLVLAVFTVTSFGNIFLQGKYLCGMLSGLLVVSILLNVSYQYSYEKGYLAEFADAEKAVDKLESNTDKAVLATKDESVYRYDQYGALPYDNTSMYMGTNSTAYYFSLANTSISDFFGEMYLNTPWEQHYENLDGRTILDRLASVKYFVISGDNFRYLSYGYNKEKGTAGSGNGECRAYENENALPLGYTYDSYIPAEKYQEMDVVKKQQALMDGVVLEESTLPTASTYFDDENIEYRVEAGDGCSFVPEKNKIVVTKEGAQVKLVFRGLTDSENYLIADNLDYDSLSPRELIGDRQWDKMSDYERNKVLDEDRQWRYWKETKEAAMTISVSDVTKTMKIFTDKYNGYSGRHDFLCNMGYSRTGLRTMTITFDNTGIYTYDNLRVVSQPVRGIEEKTKKLGGEVLEDVKLGINEITGSITVSKKKALVLSVPYSEGFTAYVDGKETKLQRANTMFMALELEPGTHDIRLIYCTPYLKMGGMLTVTGIVVFLGLVLIKRKRENDIG